MLFEQGNKAYISDKVEDGLVVKATRYICLRGLYTRVGDSIEIKGKYKQINKHNIFARHSFDAESEIEEVAENPDNENDQAEELNENTEVVVTDEESVETIENIEADEAVEHTPKYDFMELKAMNKQEQNAIAKELGLKGYHNLAEDERIEMILTVK